MTLSAMNFISSFFKLDKKLERESVEDYIDKFEIKTPTMEQKPKFSMVEINRRLLLQRHF